VKIPVKYLVLAVLLPIFSYLDWAFTKEVVVVHGGIELNPVAGYIIGYCGIYALLAYKTVGSLLISAYCLAVRRYRLLMLASVLMGGVCLWMAYQFELCQTLAHVSH
jgi:hypothetical protein